MFKHKKQSGAYSHAWLNALEGNLPNKRIVKKSGSTEAYLRSKLALSVHKACMDATGYLGEAETTALQVCQAVEAWLDYKYEVTSSDIKRVATRALRQFNPQAAFEYQPSKANMPERDDYGFIRL